MKRAVLISALVSSASCAFAQASLGLTGPYAPSYALYESKNPSFRAFNQDKDTTLEWDGKYLLHIQDVELRVSLSRHLNFKDAHEYNAFHPEFRMNFKEGVSVGAYRNSNYYWSPYISFRLYDFTKSTSVNMMVAWYGDKGVPVLVWKTELFRGVELFAITHPLLETSKVVAGASFNIKF
jgi:hypothetical protein